MTTGRDLGERDLRFINLVAARRFAGSDPSPPQALDAALAQVTGVSAFERSASLAAVLLASGAFSVAPRPTAFLAMCVQLNLHGYDLLAPQGVAAGMMAGLAAGRLDVAAVARWLEDRSVGVGMAG
jgi:hypothetical protein